MDRGDASEPRLRPLEEGRYVDFTPVGHGGMGIVYWALDTELSRQIAFKVIRPPGTADEDGVTPSAPLALSPPDPAYADETPFDGLRRRFLQEAWVTGGMEHPGIVPVYELGETERGVPYYTMRFIRGSRTLRSAIEGLAEAGFERRIDDLLEPFLKVCDTIRYAHSCGVIHRDLKPDNVAIGEYGEVVVLDWGLAKVKGQLDASEDPWSGRVLDVRREGEFQTVASAVGTPGFMSPEAARGEIEALDEQSDVYALGVMLFQILTGSVPFPSRSPQAYVEQVLTQAPPDPRSLEPDIPRHLASLCRRALAVAPADRPASADEFAKAIRAWRSDAAQKREVHVLLEQAATALELAHTHKNDERLQASLDRATTACRRVLDLDPGHAEAGKNLERAHALREAGLQERERHARRRTLWRVAGVFLVVGLLAAVTVAWLLESRRREAADARRLAEQDRARAEGVMNFMVFELTESLEPIGRLDVLARLGATARQYYANLPREGVSTKSLIGHTVTLRRLGEVYEARGGLPAALEAYRLAGDVADRILKQAPDDPLGRYHRSLAEAKVGMALFRQGYTSDAKRVFLTHREDVERLLRDNPDDPEYLDALASAHAAIGHILRTEGRWDDARRAYSDALAISAEMEAQHPAQVRWTRSRIHLQSNFVRLLRDEGKLEQARAHAQATLDECLRHMALDHRAADARWMELEAAGRYGLAVAYGGASSGDPDIYDAAHQAYERLHVLDPDNDTWHCNIARVRILQSRFHFQNAEPEKALPFTSEAFEIAKGLTRKDPTNASWQNLMITLCDHMARHAGTTEAGKPEALAYRALAAEHARHLLTLDLENAKWRHILAYTLSRLGCAYLEVNDDRARGLLTRSIEVAAALVEANPTEYELVVLQALSRADLASLEVRTERRDAGLRQWQLALDDLYRCWEGGAHPHEVATTLVMMHERLAGELRADDEDERAQVVRHLRAACDFIQRIVTTPPAWPAENVHALDARRRGLVRTLEALKADPSGPK